MTNQHRESRLPVCRERSVSMTKHTPSWSGWQTRVATVAEAALALRRARFARRTAEQYDKLRNDPVAWQSYLEEGG